jgi:hypothetical protein
MACTEIFHAEDEQLVKGLGEMSKIATAKESAG